MTAVLERFWSKVNRYGPTVVVELGACWVWTGQRDRKSLSEDDVDLYVWLTRLFRSRSA